MTIPQGAPGTDQLRSLRDIFRYAISSFNAAGLSYGHGTTNALDEAAFLVLETLNLPIDKLEPFLDARLTPAERDLLLARIAARVTTRKPLPYITGSAYIQGVRFKVDERAIVPRSFIGELLFSDELSDEEIGLIGDPLSVGSVLDLCTGGGSLAILAANMFPGAIVDALDISPAALALAAENISNHGLEHRITLYQGDLYAPLQGRRYDLILANPPYVASAEMAELPPEYRAEPELALAGGTDGLDIVRRIIDGAAAHLSPEGALMCEIGTGGETLEENYPDLTLLWLDTAESMAEVFWLSADQLGSDGA